MSKFTPGPWIMRQWGQQDGDDPRGRPCQMIMYGGGRGFRETVAIFDLIAQGGPLNTANARLMTMAPQLLTALEKLIGEIDGADGSMVGQSQALREARAVVGKLGGQQ